jgi:formate dehydrogenase gamma subunit
MSETPKPKAIPEPEFPEEGMSETPEPKAISEPEILEEGMSETPEPKAISEPEILEEGSKRKYLRFTRIHRAEHWVFMASFSILGLTGLVQKYASARISESLIAGMGGIENVRLIHHIAAIVMMVVVVYHIGAVGYRLFVRRVYPTMVPGMHDVRAAIQSLAYYLGLRKTRPQQGRYTFEEKAEYWAVVWGTVIMVITGFMMWNPIATARILPGEFIPAAKAAHGGEALLAVLAIILWHFYHVLVRTFNRSMFNGYLTEEEMLHEHPMELADIKAGLAERPTDPGRMARRRQTFFPVYGVLAGVLLIGIYAFVTFEQTALETRPPVDDVEVFVPLPPTPLPTLPPTPTPSADLLLTWEGGIGELFNSKCTTCHGDATQLGGLDLSTYATALEGGDTGPGIVPGDPDASQVILKQTAGGHAGQFSPEELDQIREWVEAGAPEN